MQQTSSIHSFELFPSISVDMPHLILPNISYLLSLVAEDHQLHNFKFSSCVSPSYYPNCRLNTASSASFWKKEQRCLWQNASWLPNCLTVEGDVGDHTQTQSASQGLWAATRAQMHRLDTHLQVRSMGENITKLQVTVMESTAVSCYRSKDECVFLCLFHACL